MIDQRATARKISSFAAPTDDDLAYFDSLSADGQRALLQAEVDKGFAGGLGDRSFEEIVAQARAKSVVRCGGNG